MSFELGFAVAFVTAGLVSFCVASVCEKPLSILMRRIIQNEASSAFTRYVRYVTYLVGISHGVRVHPIGFEIVAHSSEHDYEFPIHVLQLNLDYQLMLMWTQMVIMQSLSAIAYMYLAFFIFGLIAYITVKVREQQLLE